MPWHRLIHGEMNRRTSAADGTSHAIGFEMRPTTAIAVMASLEVAGLRLPYGAQVIAEFARLGRRGTSPTRPLDLSHDA